MIVVRVELWSERIPCAVPGCGRSRSPDSTWAEFICPRHWAAVDRRSRRILHLLHRRIRRLGSSPRLVALENRVWSICKHQAIERAVGIAA